MVEAAIAAAIIGGGVNAYVQDAEDAESVRLAESERDQAIRDFYGDDMVEGGDAASGGVEGESRLRMEALGRERATADRDLAQARTLLGLNTGAQARGLIETTSDSLEQAKMQGAIAGGQAKAAMGRSGAEVGIGTANTVVNQTSREAEKLINKVNERFGGHYADLMGEHGARAAGFDAAGADIEATFQSNQSLLTNTFKRNKALFDVNRGEYEGFIASMNDPLNKLGRIGGYFMGGAAQGLQFARMGYEAFQPGQAMPTIPPMSELMGKN